MRAPWNSILRYNKVNMTLMRKTAVRVSDLKFCCNYAVMPFGIVYILTV